MKKINLTFFTLLITLLSFSQKVKVIKGNVKTLNGIEHFTVKYDYNSVQIPNYKSEEDFLNTKVAFYEKKEKGLGTKFRKEWFSNRNEIYEPFFEKSFNKWYNKKDKTIITDANYIIEVKITNLYTGYNVVAINQYAKISAVFAVYKKDNPEKILFKGEIINAKGGKSYELTKRFSIAYYNLAKTISIYIKRKSK